LRNCGSSTSPRTAPAQHRTAHAAARNPTFRFSLRNFANGRIIRMGMARGQLKPRRRLRYGIIDKPPMSDPFIDQLLTRHAIEPVLVDVGASGGAPRAFKSLGRHATYTGFDPDSREM